MATRDHRSPKVVAFNGDVTVRQRFELSKQLQAERTDVDLLSTTYIRKALREILYSKLTCLSDRPLTGLKRRNCRCS